MMEVRKVLMVDSDGVEHWADFNRVGDDHYGINVPTDYEFAGPPYRVEITDDSGALHIVECETPPPFFRVN